MLGHRGRGGEGKGGEGRRGGESSFLEHTRREILPGKTGHLTGSCIIITWKRYGYDFILKWPLLKDKDTQLERTQKISNKTLKWQILGFSSCSHVIDSFRRLSLESSFQSGCPNSTTTTKNPTNYSLTCFLSLWMDILWDSTRSNSDMQVSVCGYILISTVNLEPKCWIKFCWGTVSVVSTHYQLLYRNRNLLAFCKGWGIDIHQRSCKCKVYFKIPLRKKS